METTDTTIENKEDSPEEKELDLEPAHKILASYPKSRRYLIPILQKIHVAYRFLPPEVVELITEDLKVSKAQIYGVISFFPQLLTTEPGKYILKLCTGTACFVKGASIIAEKIFEGYHIRETETDEKKLFTLQTASCLGNCGAAPILMVGDDFNGNLAPEDTLGLLAGYKDKGEEEVVEEKQD